MDILLASMITALGKRRLWWINHIYEKRAFCGEPEFYVDFKSYCDKFTVHYLGRIKAKTRDG